MLIFKGDAWHLIVGGHLGRDSEAFNFVTGQSCILNNSLPAGFEKTTVELVSGETIDTFPTFCGGRYNGSSQADCYQFELSALRWKKVIFKSYCDEI